MPVHFLWFLFDWRGRISRSAYRTAFLVLALFVASLKLAPDKLHAMLVGVLIAQLVVQASLDAKRLHDIGFSALWVPVTSLAAIGVAAVLSIQAPELLAVLGRHVGDIMGPDAAKGGPLAIAVTGLSAAAVLRTSLLWHPKSNKGGDRYDYSPGKARGEIGDESEASANAEALIARALAEQNAKAMQASAAEPARAVRASASASPNRPAPAGARRSFGMRKSA